MEGEKSKNSVGGNFLKGDQSENEVNGSLSGTSQRRLSNRPGQFQNQLLKSNEQWTVEETERMLQYMAKVFMMQFPLYSGPKQAGHRNEEVYNACLIYKFSFQIWVIKISLYAKKLLHKKI